MGVVINANTVIGNDVRILHHVTLGTNKVPGKAPIIGDNVVLQSYCMVLGNVKVGNNCVIGAGSILMHDLPDNCVYYNKRVETIKKINE